MGQSSPRGAYEIKEVPLNQQKHELKVYLQRKKDRFEEEHRRRREEHQRDLERERIEQEKQRNRDEELTRRNATREKVAKSRRTLARQIRDQGSYVSEYPL